MLESGIPMPTIAAETSTCLSSLDQAPLAVQEFVVRERLLPDLQEAVAAALGVFDVSGQITLFLEEDPDISESWVEIRVAARGSVEDIMKAHDSYSERLLTLPTTSTRQIRLFLHVARD